VDIEVSSRLQLDASRRQIVATLQHRVRSELPDTIRFMDLSESEREAVWRAIASPAVRKSLLAALEPFRVARITGPIDCALSETKAASAGLVSVWPALLGASSPPRQPLPPSPYQTGRGILPPRLRPQPIDRAAIEQAVLTVLDHYMQSARGADAAPHATRGLNDVDLPLYDEMDRLLLGKAVPSIFAAAKSVAPRAQGNGMVDSKARRLERGYRIWKSRRREVGE
jgi:hypothetical protein